MTAAAVIGAGGRRSLQTQSTIQNPTRPWLPICLQGQSKSQNADIDTKQVIDRIGKPTPEFGVVFKPFSVITLSFLRVDFLKTLC